MENTLTLFFLICYALAVFVVMRIIRGKFSLTVRRIVLVVLIFIPAFDSVASEIVYLVVKRENTSNEIYYTAMTNTMSVVGQPCNVIVKHTNGASFINKRGFSEIILPSRGLISRVNEENVCKIKEMLFNRRKKCRYIVWTIRDSIMNVKFRKKIVYDIKDNVILGYISDVSIVRYIPFFVNIILPSNADVYTSGDGNFCDFEYNILLYGN